MKTATPRTDSNYGRVFRVKIEDSHYNLVCIESTDESHILQGSKGTQVVLNWLDFSEQLSLGNIELVDHTDALSASLKKYDRVLLGDSNVGAFIAFDESVFQEDGFLRLKKDGEIAATVKVATIKTVHDYGADFFIVTFKKEGE